MERRHIEVVLEQAMTLEEAAEMLGINVATLWRKRQRYGLD
jgi:DNA-binding protein Fis